MRGTVVISAAVAAAALAGPSAAGAGAGAGTSPECAAGAPGPDAIVCQVNAARDRRDVAPLRMDARLARAAQRYADALGTTGPLAHQLDGGRSPAARIAATGYGGKARRFDFTEVLGRSSGTAATPEQRVQTWLGDAGIRRGLLAKRFRDLGVGVVTAGDTTTYVAVVAVPLSAPTRTAKANSKRASGSSRRSPSSSRSWATR